MLMMIGPVRLKVAPFNVTAYSQARETGYVAKPVLGGLEPLEYVGEGRLSVNVTGKLYPEKFGGLSSLQILELARASGTPQWLMRADGGMMGWVAIEAVTEQSSYLDRRGVGRMIDVDIRLRRVGAPQAATFFSALAGLFG